MTGLAVWRAHCHCGHTIEHPDPFVAVEAREAHVWPGGHAVTAMELVCPDEHEGEQP